MTKNKSKIDYLSGTKISMDDIKTVNTSECKRWHMGGLRRP